MGKVKVAIWYKHGDAIPEGAVYKDSQKREDGMQLLMSTTPGRWSEIRSFIMYNLYEIEVEKKEVKGLLPNEQF